MDSVRKALDSVGAKLHIEAANVPVGLGEPIFDRLDRQKLPYDHDGHPMPSKA